MSKYNPFLSLLNRFDRFAEEESGMTLPMVALSFLAISGFIGSAVDIARLQLVQSKLSYSLDAAGLAAATTLNSSNYTAEVSKYLNVNFPAGYLGSSSPGITVELMDNNNTMSLTANTTVPTTFMNIFGISSVNISASSEVKRKTSGLELVLVLDNTGSMSSAIGNLKNAANTLVNLLFGGSAAEDKLWIGLVPFSMAVNIGTSHSTWMDAAYNTTLNWGSQTWKGCVESRFNGYDVTDDPPSASVTDTLFRQYYYYPGSSYYTNHNTGCPQQIQTLTANQSLINSAINSMVATGNTVTPTGLVWGWRMLSPNWRGHWGGEMDANGLPLDYGTPHMNKAIVILSDGKNEYNAYYGSYGRPSELRLGSSSLSVMNAALDTRLANLCTTIKDQDIYIYSIALGSLNTATKALLRNCATSPLHYFESPTSAQLQNVFGAIADSLSNLRVSR